MKRVLVPVDPTQPARTRSAIEQVVRMARDEPLTACLLRVQPKVSGHVSMFFDPRELRELQQTAGAEELEPARALLEAAGVPCTCTVLVGRSAPTIVAAARDLGCDRIVFAKEEPSLAASLFGSLAHQVRQTLGSAADLRVIGS
ncbi:universal stress protein [Piscinibacter koreensis]|uniref:Universal stress protein n=1 Tax=Piscinibacter koreensis TaxID=2742824 RepID=A0A7Y6TVQ0_9BURK|nr:universal stress protein [Schlegelella koreensis]NUZ05270.1 universal stress protein [Schlegelella koreensis]